MIAITQERMDRLSQMAYPNLDEAVEVLESIQHIKGKTFSIVTVEELNIVEFNNGMFGIEVSYYTQHNERAAFLPYFYKIVNYFLAGDITVNKGFMNELNAIQEEEALMIDFYNNICSN